MYVLRIDTYHNIHLYSTNDSRKRSTVLHLDIFFYKFIYIYSPFSTTLKYNHVIILFGNTLDSIYVSSRSLMTTLCKFESSSDSLHAAATSIRLYENHIFYSCIQYIYYIIYYMYNIRTSIPRALNRRSAVLSHILIFIKNVIYFLRCRFCSL